MEARAEMESLQKLFEDEGLREKVAQIEDEREIVDFVVGAGRERDIRLDPDFVRNLFVDIRVVRTPPKLSTDELSRLTDGGLMAAGSENKLCHTESCGGNHAGCC